VEDKTLNELADEIMINNESKGWNEDFVLSNAICNAHTEISEAWEHIRNGHSPTDIWFEDGGKPDGFSVELIDEIIRCLHILKMLNIDPQQVMKLKMDYNKTRPYRHGNKTC
jgi:hypothetical protein